MTINKTDLTDVQETLKNSYLTKFELTDYDGNGSIELAAGRSEDIGGFLYIVEDGDQTITDGGVADGDVYVHVLDSGTGIASAYLDTHEGLPDSNKGGYYYSVTGAKVIFKMIKRSSAYYSKQRMGSESQIYLSNGISTDNFTPGFALTQSNRLAMGSISDPAICGMSKNRIALVDTGVDELRMYEFDGTDFAQVGNGLSVITASGVYSITGLSNTRVALIDSIDEDLRVYDFDGTDWSKIGNDFNISGAGEPTITGLTSSSIAYIDSALDSLRTYAFDGTDWTQTGNSLSISTYVAGNLSTLTSTRISMINVGTGTLSAYDFDGTDWSIVGNALSLSGLATKSALQSISSSRVILWGTGRGVFAYYDFDGTDWYEVGYSFPLTNTNAYRLAVMNTAQMAVYSDNYGVLYELDLIKIPYFKTVDKAPTPFPL